MANEGSCDHIELISQSDRSPVRDPKYRHGGTRTRTNTIPNGTQANAARLSGCECVTRIRSGVKKGGMGKARKFKALE
jgi:hypothetical protein